VQRPPERPRARGRFPEQPRLLAEAGAELLLVSNACDLTDWHLAMLRARAFSNGVAVGMANYAAPACNGRSPAYGAAGEVLVVAADAEERVVMAEVDLGELRAVRASAAGLARRAPLPTPRLCAPTKVAQFARESPLGRPQHSM
jgi:predicted amidohydrolase